MGTPSHPNSDLLLTIHSYWTRRPRKDTNIRRKSRIGVSTKGCSVSASWTITV